jgi:hypothetical protein
MVEPNADAAIYGIAGFARPALMRLLFTADLDDFPNVLMFGRCGAFMGLHVVTLVRRADPSSGPFREVDNSKKNGGAVRAAANTHAIAYFFTGNESADMEFVCGELKEVSSAAMVASQHGSPRRRMVILANVDRAPRVCQMAMRKIIEQNVSTTLFVLTCGQTSGVESAVASRCMLVNCNPLGSVLEEGPIRRMALAPPSGMTMGDITSTMDRFKVEEGEDVPDSSETTACRAACGALLIALAQRSLTEHGFKRIVQSFFAACAASAADAGVLPSAKKQENTKTKTKQKAGGPRRMPSAETAATPAQSKIGHALIFNGYVMAHPDISDARKHDILAAAAAMDVDLTLAFAQDYRSGSTTMDPHCLSIVLNRFFWNVHMCL